MWNKLKCSIRNGDFLFTFTIIDCAQKYFDKYSFKVYNLKNGISKYYRNRFII
jgi:hypothetical protein